MARVLDDGDDVRALLSDVDEVATGPVREFYSVYAAALANQVGHMRDGRARGGAKVQHLGTRSHVNGIDASEDGGRNPGTRTPVVSESIRARGGVVCLMQ